MAEIWQPLLVIQGRYEIRELPVKFLGMRFVANGDENPHLSPVLEALYIGEVHVSLEVMNLGINQNLLERLIADLRRSGVDPASAFNLAI